MAGIGDKLRGKSSTSSEEELFQFYTSKELQNLNAFEKLKLIHNIAPLAIPYEPSKPMRTLFRLSQTGLALALQRPDFWIIYVFHVCVSLLYYGLGNSSEGGQPTAPDWPEIDISVLTIPGTLITFVLVFYVNQTYSRMVSQSQRIFATGGLLGELLVFLRVNLGDHISPKAMIARHQLCKMINSLHFLMYASLPQKRKEKINEWAFWFLEDSKLLTKKQVETLRPLQAMGSGNLAYKEVIMWLNEGIWAQQSKGYIDNRVASLFTFKLWKIRENVDGLYSFVSGPVPFAYFHLLNFVLVVYLFMLAYAYAFFTPYWTFPSFFLVLVSLIGFRELSNAMSNPLGNDSLDIPVLHLAWKFLNDSVLLINRSLSYPEEDEEMKPTRLAYKPSHSGLLEVPGLESPKGIPDFTL